ncbi:MAG: tRNA epoxyqueuosine(34) reductase QueG [Bacillaceae bacterium]
MNIEALQQELVQYSKEIGIDKIGFTSAAPFTELKERLIKQRELNYQSGFEEPDIERRTTPTLLLDGAQSIISIAMAYPSKMKESPRSTKEERRGMFCRASWGEDYHIVLKKRLTLLADFLQARVPNVQFKIMVDTGELSDRAVAERAGIGWSGKNCSIITPEFGSYVYLGEMIVNIPFKPDTPLEDMCGTCRKCLDACPTNALVSGGQINAKRCIAYLTQTKEPIPEEFIKKIGNRIYGCDSCQTACPYNKGVDFHLHEEMEAEGEIAKPLLKPILTLSNRSFKEQFGHVAGSWRGKNPIQRNAIIGLAHFKDKTAIPLLIEMLKKDARPMIRQTAAWALGEIGEADILEILEQLLVREKEGQVQQAIEKTIAKLKE